MAKLHHDDLLVAQLRDTIHPANQLDQIVSVRFKTVVDSAVHKAKPGDPSDDYANLNDDKAGLMYPGKGFYYDSDSGRLDVKVDSDLEFKSIVDNDTLNGAINDWYVHDPETKRGAFYVVGSDDVLLDSNIWRLDSGVSSSPDLGDLVVCTEDSISAGSDTPYGTHKWNVIPNVTGGQAVLSLSKETPTVDELSTVSPIEIKTDGNASSQRPQIRIRYAGKNSTTNDYQGGLVSDTDAEKIGEFDLNLFEQGFVTDVTLHGDEPTLEALHLDTVSGHLDPNDDRHQYKGIVIKINPAQPSNEDPTTGGYGVVELATQGQVDYVVGDASIDPSGRSEETAMTPKMTADNFVPRMFKHLAGIETINTI